MPEAGPLPAFPSRHRGVACEPPVRSVEAGGTHATAPRTSPAFAPAGNGPPRASRRSPQQMTSQSGVHDVQLGGFDQALSEVGRPRREAVNQKDGFQQCEIAGQGRVWQAGVRAQVREVH